MKEYFVYIATNTSRTLYTGVTSDLRRREWQHATGQSSFTSRYRINRVVYFETFVNASEAMQREKEIKTWRRSKKIALIESINPNWTEGAWACLP